MTKISPITILVAVAVVAIIAVSTIAINGQRRIEEITWQMQRVCKLRTDILQANLALRNAMLVSDGHSRETELGKMLLTRSSANQVYDDLTMSGLGHREAVLLEEMKKERQEYRNAQLKVVALVRDGSQVTDVTQPLLYYQTLVDRYIQRTYSLHELIESRLGDAVKTNKIMLAIGIGLGVCVVAGFGYMRTCR